MKISYGPACFFLLITVCALLLCNAPGTNDVSTLQTWSHIIAHHGPLDGYSESGADYPPLSVLLIAGAVGQAEALSLPGATGIKGLILVFLLLTSLVFYLITRNLALTTALQGAFLLNSTALGYVDVLFAPPLLAALVALERRRRAWATTLFIVACLLKWQVIIIAPFLLIQMLEIRTLAGLRTVPWRRLALEVAVPALVLVGGVILLFRDGVVLSFWYALTRSTYLSGTALNLGWVVTALLHGLDPATYGSLTGGAIGIISNPAPLVAEALRLVFAGVFVAVLILFFRAEKTFSNLLRYATLGYLAYVLLNTGVHENHLFLAVLLLALLAQRERAALPDLAVWATVFNLNMVVFYGLDGRGLPFSVVVGGVDLTLLLAGLAVLLFVGFFARVAAAGQQEPSLAPGRSS